MPKQPRQTRGEQSPPYETSTEKSGKDSNGTINNREDQREEEREKERSRGQAAIERVRDVVAKIVGPEVLGEPAWVGNYLEALALNGGQVGKAAEKAGCCFSMISRRRKSDPHFVELEADAMACAKVIAEDEARRRALDGVVTMRQTVVKNGVTTISEKIEYSDTILLRLLERLETGSWRQKQTIDAPQPGVFATRAERKAALEKLRQETREREARSLSGTVPLPLPSEKEVEGREVTERDPWKKAGE